MNVNGIDWQHPLEVPVVEMGTEKEFWIAVYSEHSKRQRVFLAHFQNRPLVLDDNHELVEHDWYLEGDGDLIHSVGWVEHTRHSEYSDFYEPIVFGEDYRLLGWAEYEPPKFVSLDKAETPELPISKFKICQMKMCAAIASELSRQCPGITTEQSQMGAIIKAADLICDAVNNQGVQTSKDTIAAEAVMYFANSLVGAYETGFIEDHQSNLADLHGAARMHVKINYEYEAQNIVEAWGADVADWCKNGCPHDKTSGGEDGNA